MSNDAPYGLDDPQLPDDRAAALRRVRPPAIFLLVLSVLNLLAGLYLMFNGIVVKKSADAQAIMKKQWDDMKPEDRDAVKKIGINSSGDFVTLAGNVSLGWGGPMAIVSVLTVFGAIRMLSLHSYGLAMFGAIVTVIPCLTLSCLLGQVAGIWAFVILLQPDVRKAFH